MLKLLSTAEKVEAVKVETQVEFTNMLTTLVSQIHHANNTLPTILMLTLAKLSTDARTAPGHHAQRAKLAKTNAGQSNTRTTKSPTMVMSVAPKE